MGVNDIDEWQVRPRRSSQPIHSPSAIDHTFYPTEFTANSTQHIIDSCNMSGNKSVSVLKTLFLL